MSVSIEKLKSEIDILANESYEEGWADCKENYSHQQFSPARTEALSDTVRDLQKDNKLFKKKLALATKLLRYAQGTICGAQGQFDRFFDEGYNYDSLEFDTWVDEDEYFETFPNFNVASDKTSG